MIEFLNIYFLPIMSFFIGVMFGVLSFTAAAFGLIVWREHVEHKQEKQKDNHGY